MTIKEVKTTKPRIVSKYSHTWGIQLFGEHNTYPEDMAKHIAASATGSGCLERYSTFIEGNGLNDAGFSEYVCNRNGETVDDVFHSIAQDLATHNGFAIHVYYDETLRICEMQHVPFMSCRLSEETEDGKVHFIAYHPDWTGEKTRNGKQLKVSKETIQKIYVFNPNPDVVLSQINADGGLHQYKGQILWVSMEGAFKYPRSIFDKCITAVSTDEGLDNVKYRNVRNNFLPSGMLIRRKGGSIVIDDNGNEYDTSSDQSEEMRQTLETFQGDENTGVLLDIEVNSDEDIPEWRQIESTNFDKKFDVTEESTTEKIYSAFGQEPFYSIRKGKVGFSGTIINDAYNYYNSYVAKERRCISRSLDKIFKHWNSVVNVNGDYSIQPLVLIHSDQAV